MQDDELMIGLPPKLPMFVPGGRGWVVEQERHLATS